MLKILSLAGGLAGAAGLSQFPEFSQQYLQIIFYQLILLSTLGLAFKTAQTRP